MKKIAILFTFYTSLAAAQDVQFAHHIVDTLTAPYFWGRGYTKDGMHKAADFLADEFRSFGVAPMEGKSYFQRFEYPVNTFPGKMNVSINGQLLTPGLDYIVSEDSRGLRGRGSLQQADSVQFVNQSDRLVVKLENKLTWSVAPGDAGYTAILLDKNRFSGTPSSYDVSIENRVVPSFKAANVCGIVKGTRQPDSIIVITAHYDHLGGMGSEAYFPGANDNASGISLLLNLARYYGAHPQPYSIAFICFAGEEAGLLGSKYFTEHPQVPLKNIRFLLNTDLAGTGEDGITVVNATEFPKEFALLNEVNDQQHLLKKINVRGKAANSDHYFFTEKGVPAFFFYTMGGITAYHDVLDKSATLPLNEHEDLFKLVVGFNNKLMGN